MKNLKISERQKLTTIWHEKIKLKDKKNRKILKNKKNEKISKEKFFILKKIRKNLLRNLLDFEMERYKEELASKGLGIKYYN